MDKPKSRVKIMQGNNHVIILGKDQRCPVCSRDAFSTTLIPYEIPHFRMSMFFVLHCDSCGYKNSDIISMDEKKPVRQSIRVSGSDALDVRVIKSSTAKVIVPGIIEVVGGSMSEGYISNVEGVLNRILGALEFARHTSEDEKEMKLAERHIRHIRDAIDGVGSIDLIIDDPAGNSAILGKHMPIDGVDA